MKLRDLILKLQDYDMESAVKIHSANGTIPLEIKQFHDHQERCHGDTDEPRLTLMCYKEDPPATAPDTA